MDTQPKDDAQSWEQVRREHGHHPDDLPPGERDYWQRDIPEEERERR